MAWFRWRRTPAKGPSEQTSSVAAPYLLPSDDREINRLDFQHFMLRTILRSNYLAAIADPHAIIDVGCGTGRWAIEMATQFPNANVIGVDMTPPPAEAQAAHDVRPDNYTFVQGDVLAGLSFDANSFDFVHQRLLGLAVPGPRWPGVIAELARITRPGGWVEVVEPGEPKHIGPAQTQLWSWVAEFGNRRSIDLFASAHLREWLTGAGLVQLGYKEVRVPVGAHGGRVGKLAQVDVEAIFTALRPAIIGMQIAPADAYDAATTQLGVELVARHNACYWPFYVAYAQRPR